MIVFVIHESYTAKIPHLYSGCQVFGDIFLLKVVFFFEVSAITFLKLMADKVSLMLMQV